MMAVNGQFIEAAGFRTHYHEAGSGKTVLLLHGSGPGVSAWANWRPVFDLMSDRFHLLAPDILGFGQTERPGDNRYTLDRWMEHLIAFLEVKEAHPLCVVGNSFGGALALHLAHRRPEWVEKLVLMGSIGIRFQLSEGLDAVWGYTPSLDNMKRLIQYFAYDKTFAENEELIQMRYRASMAEHESFAAMFPAPRQRHVDALALDEEALRQLDVPTLLIHGRDDEVIPVAETSWRLLHLMPNAKLHVYPRCGHWVQIEKKFMFAEDVAAFLSRDNFR